VVAAVAGLAAVLLLAAVYWPQPGGLPARLVLLLDGELPSAKDGG
jgi:hypothetical protein